MKKTILFLFIFLKFFIVAKSLSAMTIKTTARDKNISFTIKTSSSTLIGDVFDFTIDIEYSDFILLTNFVPKPNFVNFEIKDAKVFEPSKKFFSNKVVKRYNFKLATFTKGVYKIPGFSVDYELDHQKFSLTSKEIVISVFGVITQKDAKNLDIKDIKKNFSFIDTKIIIFLCVLFLSLVAAAFYFLIRRKRKLEEEKLKLPAHTIAFQKLEKLKNSNLLANNEIKTFYILLTEIFKEYLEDRFNIEIMEKTTYEISFELKKNYFDPSLIVELRNFFEECDLVKFAKYIPTTLLIDEHYSYVYNFVTKTKIEEISENLNLEAKT